jgi:hypothetical protein
LINIKNRSMSSETNNKKTLSGPAALFGVSPETVLQVSDDEWRKQLQTTVESTVQFERRQRERNKHNVKTDDDNVEEDECVADRWLGSDRNVPLRIQSGPSCGLVAVQLSVEHLIGVRCHDDAQALLRGAVERHFSKLGEMFSAYQLAELASAVYGARLGARTVTVHALDSLPSLDARAAFLAQCVQRGALVLLAYDADKDNSPNATLGGTRAHWAVVKGFLMPDADADADAGPDEQAPPVRVRLDADADAASRVRARDAFFVCVHSKSKRPALWRADALLRSSAQLLKPDHARNTDNQYVMPETISDTLALKAVVIE